MVLDLIGNNPIDGEGANNNSPVHVNDDLPGFIQLLF